VEPTSHRKASRERHNKTGGEKPSGGVILVKRILLNDYVIDVSSVKMTSHEDLKSSDEGTLT
jgi:hypothetical protein